MRAIVACLLLVIGALLAIQGLLQNLWVLAPAVLLVTAGLGLLLRNPPAPLDEDTGHGCGTCRGAGTVYSAEYNDWRQTGPIRTVRELCPACQGLTP
jgi:hypothetical protein